MIGDVLPAPFVCAICQRTVEAHPWTDHVREPFRHKPPICFSCANYMGRQVRQPGMTRGDHNVLQRLVSVTEGLRGAAGRIEWEAKYGRG